MDSFIVSGLSRGQIARKLAAGEIYRIFRGVYAWREPTAWDIIRLLSKRYPESALTGKSAAEIYLGLRPTLPLQVAASHRIAASRYVSPVRTKGQPAYFVNGAQVLPAVRALDHCADAELGRQMLERVYRDKRGRERFEFDVSLCGRLSAQARHVISTAALGTDSGAEVKVLRRLLGHGVKAVANYQVGPYFWDIAIPARKVLVEIDSLEHHTDKETFVKDRWKNNDAVLRGWVTLRYSGQCVAHHLDKVVEQILGAREPRLFPAVWTWHKVLRRGPRLEESAPVGW